MKAEQLPQEDKIKYVLNGETRYYTEVELREYYKNLLMNSKFYSAEHFDSEIEHLLKTLEKYDGDPYGRETERNREFYHDMESRGHLVVIP
jgi:hypothetical protein